MLHFLCVWVWFCLVFLVKTGLNFQTELQLEEIKFFVECYLNFIFLQLFHNYSSIFKNKRTNNKNTTNKFRKLQTLFIIFLINKTHLKDITQNLYFNFQNKNK